MGEDGCPSLLSLPILTNHYKSLPVQLEHITRARREREMERVCLKRKGAYEQLQVQLDHHQQELRSRRDV